MNHFLIIFLILVCSISLVITCIGEIAWYGKDYDIDSQYYNADGDHIYYDRSLIEKMQFVRRFPHIKNLRSLSRLFSREDKF